MPSIEQSLREALGHHNAGRLQQAEQIYRQVLTADPNNAAALHLLGILAHQVGRHDAAVEMIRRAIQLGATDADNNLGEALRALGRVNEAVAAYQTAIQRDPSSPEAYSNLGAANNTLGRFAEAKPLLEKALALNPNLPNAHFNYGVTLDGMQHVEDAIEQWEITLRLQPDHPLAMNNLGLALERLGRVERAIITLQKLVQKHPNYSEGHASLGGALASAKRFDEAIAEATKAVELNPNQPEAHNSLGVVYQRAGRTADAIASTKRAIEMKPRFYAALGNLGGIYQQTHRHSEAIQFFERAAELKPGDRDTANALYGSYFKIHQYDKALEVTERALKFNPYNADLHGNRSLALLAMGEYAEGFEEYEWRWRCKSFTSPPRDFAQPMWEGSDLAGRALLVHGEQGFGDIIQFARYLPMLAKLGAKVIVEVPAAIRALVESAGGVQRTVAKGLKLPDFDLHIPLLSLPRAFKTTIENLPAKTPYLHADETRLATWRPIIETGEGMKVGLVWAGNIKPDPTRSCSMKELAVLADVPNVHFFSLQVGNGVEELNDAPPEMKIADLSRRIKDFSDTAAVMSMLDVLITIDTAAAHLGGALGIRTWTMLNYAPDWRWLCDDKTSRWYPTMRLFRQSVRGDWTPVIAQIRDELRALVNNHNSSSTK